MIAYENIKGEYPVFDFESFIPSASEPFPSNRILDFLTVGPFVLHTDGSFEAEHMYEREKILNEDYLLSDGGEGKALPVLGGKVRNKYYGDEYLYWKKGFIKWDCLRFDNDADACDPALYVTQQRNAVYYAAFYVRCERESDAVICYENSGSALFINGEQADLRPFGRVKGLWGLGYQCPVHFRRGLNLVMFKIRPGYIADSMDIAMSNCSVFPVLLSDRETGLTSSFITAAYTGEKGAEKQVFPAFVTAFSDAAEKTLSYSFGEIKLPAMKKGETLPVRFEIPSDGNKTVEARVSLNDAEKAFYFPVSPYDGYEGYEHIYSDFHFDTTYHQEQRTYALGAFHITKSIIERLISNPDFKATLSEIDYLHPYYSLYPAHREVMKESFRLGRAEADCFYNQPNDLTSSGEAFVRNLVYGQLYHRDVLGRLSTVYAPGDVFGHFSQMTQVCKKGGCDYIKWGKMMLGVDSLFRHVSPDGTSLLHDKGMSRVAAKRLGVTGCDSSSQALSYIDTFPREGDTSWMKKTVTKASFSVFSDLAKNVNESAARGQRSGENTEIQYSSRDITQHHSGVILTRTDFKQANRLCENLLVTAEKFSAIAFMHGADYPDKAIDKATRQLLCAQHHDSITGTNNEISFVDLMIEYRECASLLTDIIERACSFIASGADISDGSDVIFVFNPVTWDRGGKCWFRLPEGFTAEGQQVLTDIKGKEYPAFIEGRNGWFIAEKLPAMGYSIFRIKNTDNELSVTRGRDNTIENNRFRLEVDEERGGTIVSLYDKKEKRELIDKNAPSPANTVYVMKEIHDRMETQHELYTSGHKLLSSEYKALVVSEKCASYQKLTVTVKLDTVARLIQEITLYKNSSTVDFKTVVEDYQAEDDLFSVTFPMDIKGGAVIFDDRFAPHVSTRSKKYMSFQTHQYASFSGCRVLPSNQWFGVGPSVTVETGKTGRVNLGMTAIIRKEEKAVRDIADRFLFALTKKAIPVTLYSDKEQHGGMKIIHFNEDIYSTDTRIVISLSGDGNEYAEKLLTGLGKKDSERLGRLLEKNGSAVLYFKDSENAYNKACDVFLIIGNSVSELEKITSETENVLKKGAEIAFPDCITVDAPDISDDYGCVLINNGTPASSVEGRATLNMMLFHTAAFYGNMGKVTGDKEMVPEQKNHIFTYSLYPHKGSYREGGVYKKAQEFNDPLFGITDVKKGAVTPFGAEMSFLRSPDNFTVTAFKAAGYPYASLKKAPASPFERGFTVRGFENQGLSAKINLKTGFNVFGAVSTDLLEENPVPLKAGGNSVSLMLEPHSIETAVIKAPQGKTIGNAVIGKTDEGLKSVYIRSWEHDTGSLPMGNLTFCATVERLPRTGNTSQTLYINAVNNSLCEKISTNIRVVCSEGITAERDSISLSLEKGESRRIPLEIVLPEKGYQGQVKIFYEYDGIEYYDVYEIGYFEPEVSLKISDDEIICTMYNPTKEILTGALYLAVPFEMWGSDIPCDNRIGNISPDTHFVELSPFEEKKINIPLTADPGLVRSFWAAAKLCVNGRIYFAFDKTQGERHNVWAHEFFSEIINSGGSIEKLITM
ncbi:MAG: hypothetical protein IJO68_08340 [Clostridia bacterium]|nr:hypothetical protein [Clostridia bacterium]